MSGVMDVRDRLRRLRELRDKIDVEIARLEHGEIEATKVELQQRAPVAAVRAWAKDAGIQIPRTGRLSHRLRHAYLEAQRDSG